jgi:hypothetical protein
VVYISSSDGTNPIVSYADADTEATSSKTLGLLETALSANQHGYVITEGKLSGLNTSAATDGQAVWLSGTAGGRVYGSPPSEPAHSVFLGVVTKANASTGEIFIKVQNGYELDEIHDVSAASPTAGDVIQWATDGTTYMWRKKSLSDAGIAASSHAHSGVYDPAGTAASAITTHEAAADPHPTYLTATEGNAAYAAASHNHSTSNITSGNFAATISGGTGVTVTGGTGNASTPSIAIGQAVATSSTPTFAGLTVNGDITASSMPLRMAAGTYSTSQSTAAANGTLSVTLPASRFSVAPLVTITIASAQGGTAKIVPRHSGVTTSAFQAYWYTGDAATTTFSSVTFHYIAIQMTSSTAAG